MSEKLSQAPAAANRLHDLVEMTKRKGSKGLTVAVIGVSVISLAACSSNEAPTEPSHSHSAAATPSKTNEAVAPITAQSAEIKDTTPVDQLGKTIFADRTTTWIMGGANEASVQEYYAGNLNVIDQSAAIAAPIDEVFVQSMFTQDALNDPTTQKFIQDTETDHKDRLEYYLITAKDAKPYSWHSTADQTTVVSQNSSDVELKVTTTDHNNVVPGDKIGSKYGTSEVQDNGATGVFDVKLIDVDGTYKINSIVNITASTN